MVFGIIGGRIYHLITDPELYFLGRPDSSPWNAFKILDGGLGIWAAIAPGHVRGLDRLLPQRQLDGAYPHPHLEHQRRPGAGDQQYPGDDWQAASEPQHQLLMPTHRGQCREHLPTSHRHQHERQAQPDAVDRGQQRSAPSRPGPAAGMRAAASIVPIHGAQPSATAPPTTARPPRQGAGRQGSCSWRCTRGSQPKNAAPMPITTSPGTRCSPAACP